jgi:hypothetical protein
MKQVKLGKREVKHDPRTLMLKDYLRTDATPLPPKSTNWRKKTGTMTILMNDTIGDCGPAGALHEVQSWINCDGGSFVPTDEMALTAYTALSGYDPATGKNDNGVYLLDQCNYWIKTGIGGHKLGAYAKLTPQDHGQVLDVTNLFDGLGAGWQLPRAYQSAKVWKAPPGGKATGMWQPGSWGGHYAPIVDYDAKYVYVMSWGGIIPVEWGAYDVYSDEAYAYFSPDWFGDDSLAPNGFDWKALADDFNTVTHTPAPTPPGPAPTGKTTITISGPPWVIDSVK